MAHLLDSDIVIYQINGVAAAAQLVDHLFESGISMSAITFLEVIDGLGSANATQVARFKSFADHVPVIPFDRPEAIVAARVRAALREQGRSVRPRALDILIAATALAHDLTLVTNNPNDYQGIPGLRVLSAGIT